MADFSEDDKKMLFIGGLSIFVGVAAAIIGATGVMGSEWTLYQILIGTALITLGAVLIWLPLKKSKARMLPFSKDDGWSPELERRTAQEAKQPLSGELEALAERAGRLGHEYAKMGDAKWEELKSIGRKLNAEGGFPLMLLVCLRARELGGRHTSVSAAWDGIGKWQN